jgi:hypothetical protein
MTSRGSLSCLNLPLDSNPAKQFSTQFISISNFTLQIDPELPISGHLKHHPLFKFRAVKFAKIGNYRFPSDANNEPSINFQSPHVNTRTHKHFSLQTAITQLYHLANEVACCVDVGRSMLTAGESLSRARAASAPWLSVDI